MNFNECFYRYLDTHTLIGIKGKKTLPDFLSIWMICVNDRVFARSWKKSERSWFTAFEETGIGEIKFGDDRVKVTGKKLDPLDPIQAEISQAYLLKYDQPHNKKYAEGIAGKDYYEHTMEFFPRVAETEEKM
ncbi:DUF2255 family protein [Gramella sp. BOM4]|nr:DUF2255 family protein [Christiangramia bathymodioli]